MAIAYVMQKTAFVFPIIGGRKIEHLLANIEALSVALTDAHLKKIEAAAPFDPGFPHWLIVSIRSTRSEFLWLRRSPRC